MKKLLVLLFVCGAYWTASAQKSLGITAGTGYSRMVGQLKEFGGDGITASLAVDYYFKPDVALGIELNNATIMYVDTATKAQEGLYNITNLMLKGEWYLVNDEVWGLYASASAGVASVKTPEIRRATGLFSSVSERGEVKTNFSFQPRLGIKVSDFRFDFGYTFAGFTGDAARQKPEFKNKEMGYLNIGLKYLYRIEW